jgi:hypothetical protein
MGIALAGISPSLEVGIAKKAHYFRFNQRF